MLLQVKIDANGYGIRSGDFLHLKIVSATAPVRVRAMSQGETILDSDLRAPMAVQLSRRADKLELYSKEAQTVEVWAGLLPLDYMQLTAVGARSQVGKTTLVYPGLTQVLPVNALRKSLDIKASAEIVIGDNASGWPLPAGKVKPMETAGAVYIYRDRTPYNYAGINGASTLLCQATATALNVGDAVRFAGRTFVGAPESDYLRAILDDGTVKNPSFTVYRAMTVFADALYVVGARANSAFAVWKTTDGEAWQMMAMLDGHAGDFVGVSTNTARHREWLSFRASTSTAVPTKRGIAVSLLTGEVKYSPQATDNAASYFYYHATEQRFYQHKSGTAATDGLSVENGGAWEKLINSGSAPNDVKGMNINPETGRKLVRIGSGVRDLLDDGSTQMALTTIGSSPKYIPDLGVDAYATSTRIYITEQGGQTGEVIVSGSPESISAVTVSPQDGKIYQFLGANGTTKILHTIEAPNIPTIQPVVVNTLEYFI